MSERERLTGATPSRTIFALPYWVAEQKGFFDAEGLDPTLEVINNVETIKTKLAAGIIRLALDSPEGVIVDAYKGGGYESSPAMRVGRRCSSSPSRLLER